METKYLGEENAARLLEAFRQGRENDGDPPPTEEEVEQFVAYWDHVAMMTALMRATIAGYLVVNVREDMVLAFYSNPDNPVEVYTDNPLADQIEDILQDLDWGDEQV